jgi:hypothetical protein
VESQKQTRQVQGAERGGRGERREERRGRKVGSAAREAGRER